MVGRCLPIGSPVNVRAREGSRGARRSFGSCERASSRREPVGPVLLRELRRAKELARFAI